MKKLWLAVGLIAFLSVLIVMALVANPRSPSEPEYQGRKLTAWLDDLSDPSPTAHTNAMLAIRQMGTNAVPFLVQMLYAEDSHLKRKYMELLKRQHYVDFHVRFDFQKRNDGFRGLIILGPDAKAAVPDLINLLSHLADGNVAAFALARIGPTAVPALELALTNTNEHVRYEAAEALGNIAEPSSVSNLLVVLKDPDWIVRSTAVMALRRFPGQANVIVPALIANLNDTNGQVREITVIALGSFGERAKPAVPQILKIIEENKGDELSSEGLYNALSDIDPEAAAKLDGK